MLYWLLFIIACPVVCRRLDMLPALLSEQLCSLRSGTQRLAVSVVWTLSEDRLEVVDVWMGRTIISSSHQLSYQQVWARGAADPHGGITGQGGRGKLSHMAFDGTEGKLTLKGLRLYKMSPSYRCLFCGFLGSGNSIRAWGFGA